MYNFLQLTMLQDITLFILSHEIQVFLEYSRNSSDQAKKKKKMSKSFEQVSERKHYQPILACVPAMTNPQAH